MIAGGEIYVFISVDGARKDWSEAGEPHYCKLHLPNWSNGQTLAMNFGGNVAQTFTIVVITFQE